MNVCARYTLEALHWVWELSKFDNRDTQQWGLVTLGRCLHYFLVLLLLILSEYSLFIVNVI